MGRKSAPALSDGTAAPFLFAAVGRKNVIAAFDAGRSWRMGGAAAGQLADREHRGGAGQPVAAPRRLPPVQQHPSQAAGRPASA